VIILADEGVDRQIIDRLRADGNAVHAITEMNPGANDEWVLQTANTNTALLITADKDFGELVYRLGRATEGIFLLR
jgi:predicted nuclease of predicted toxin-antitoxin system